MSSTGVNRPTNVKAKEEDVNRKLQLYGIATAFQNGKVPSNEQIDIALNSFLKSRPMANPSKKLSSEGRALVADFRDVVEQAKYMILTKNEGNVLQDFIWESQKISGGNAKLPGAPVDKDTAKQHGNEALEGLRTLGTLIISNGQFRKLLNDATILIRDIAGDAASNAANKINPNEDDLAQIDKPADDNTWHDVPDMSAGNIKKQVKSTYSKQTPLHQEDLKAAAGDASQAAHPDGSRDPADTAALAQRDQEQGTNSGVDAGAGLQNAASTLKQRASENVPEETKEKGRKTREQTKNYLSKKMPQERREQTIWRLKKLVVECQGHPDYMQAIETLLNLAETYAGHATTLGNQATGTVKGAHGDDSLKKAEADLLLLIQRWTNGTSTDDLFESINNIYRDADKDPELKSWFKNINAYVRKCLKQQGFVLEDAATEEWNALYDRGNFLLRDRYRNHTDRVVDEVKFLADQFDKDPVNKRFAESIQKLFNDLGNDENGKPTFKPHLVKDLTDVIIPGIFESVRYVPIPRIEYSDPTMDAVIENLVIESDNLMPNVLEIANDNYIRWGRKKVANKSAHSIMLSIAGVQMDLRDVSFHIKKKQGFPSITDTGVADIFLGGSGLSFKMKMSTAEKKDRQNFFKVDKVDVDVKNFNIKLKQSKHKVLFAIVKPMMLKVMRPALQKALEKVIKDKFNEFDALAYKVKLEADRAIEEAKENPENAPNIYQRYVNALQKQLLHGKQKAEAVAADKKVNVAMTQHDSIFPNIKLPGGISSKATEYKELGQKGETWHSPIFKLGSASPSSDIPKAPSVTRKDHSVTTGGVRGPQNVGNTDSMTNKLNDPSAQAAGTTSGTSFGNQVDQALNPSANGNGINSSATNGNGYTNGKVANGNTTLGSNNPVLTGSV
ncbi:hypothetical protein ONS95_000382 [Cadophora gregata]|uniref:uncharacterized protein n=1 Tax=Cadophora gregata TaxID=51156 RepID=UPI0026DCFC7D|nr:uncharacterized protein ONS95_000382 [Cadophora gregata]KAK0128409.1 hypothetical protein ONS95_000382 [Cadophora gregata]